MFACSGLPIDSSAYRHLSGQGSLAQAAGWQAQHGTLATMRRRGRPILLDVSKVIVRRARLGRLGTLRHRLTATSGCTRGRGGSPRGRCGVAFGRLRISAGLELGPEIVSTPGLPVDASSISSSRRLRADLTGLSAGQVTTTPSSTHPASGGLHHRLILRAILLDHLSAERGPKRRPMVAHTRPTPVSRSPNFGCGFRVPKLAELRPKLLSTSIKQRPTGAPQILSTTSTNICQVGPESAHFGGRFRAIVVLPRPSSAKCGY